jgi:hypothetical protein
MAKFKAPKLNAKNIIPTILFWIVIGFIAVDGSRHLIPFFYHSLPLLIVAIVLWVFIKMSSKEPKEK